MKVLIADILGQEGKNLLLESSSLEVIEFSNTISQEDFRELLKLNEDTCAVILGLTRFGREELTLLNDIKVVSRIGVGYDAVDVDLLTEKKIPLMVCEFDNYLSVAEHTLSFMMNLAKKTNKLNNLVIKNKWKERYNNLPIELSGKGVLIIGYGRIGKKVAEFCKAFDMEINVYDPYVESIPTMYNKVDSIDNIITNIDFITVHCPKNLETINLISKEVIDKLNKKTHLINTSRGGVVDENYLIESLLDGRISGVALDVFNPEPAKFGMDIPDDLNLITSPHLSGVTKESVRRMAITAANNVINVVLHGDKSKNLVNKEILR